jgi:hypothetical protein
MLLQIALLLSSSILCAILYRMGGAKGYDTAYRDWGLPFVVCTVLWLRYGGHLTLIPVYFLMGGALTTYWEDAFGYHNFWFSGFMVGLALFPYIIQTHMWLWFVKPFIMAVVWGLWRKYRPGNWTKDAAVTEELGTGALTLLVSVI